MPIVLAIACHTPPAGDSGPTEDPGAAAWCAQLAQCGWLGSIGWTTDDCAASVQRSDCSLATCADAIAGLTCDQVDAGLPATCDACATGDVPLVTADAWYVGERDEDAAGRALAAADLDGDGDDELIVAAWGSGTYYDGPGAVYVVDPAPGFHGLSEVPGAIRSEAIEVLGTTVAAGSDLDQDGRADLIVGAPETVVDGTAYGAALIFGAEPAALLRPDDAVARVTGVDFMRQAGMYAVVLGDVDGDGLDDVAVSSVQTIGYSATYVHVLAGPLVGDHVVTEAESQWSLGPNWAAAPMPAGDLDGDGRADLAVDVPLSGFVSVYHAPFAPYLAGDAGDALIVGESDSELGRGSAAAGDVDGDGTDDLLLGAKSAGGADRYRAGAAFLVRGPIEGRIDPRDAPVTWVGTTENQTLGASLGRRGDTWMVGADEDALGGADGPGAVYLYGSLSDGEFGPADAEITLRGVAWDDAVGRNATLGDFDGDGVVDLATAPNTPRGAVAIRFGRE